MIKLPRQPPNHRFVASVRKPKPTARKTTQMPVRTNDDNRFAHPPGLHRGHDARRGPSIHHKVGVRANHRRLNKQNTQQHQAVHSSQSPATIVHMPFGALVVPRPTVSVTW